MKGEMSMRKRELQDISRFRFALLVGSRPAKKCAWLICLAHAHNEKSCHITIDKILRYEGVSEEKMSANANVQRVSTLGLYLFSIFLILAVRLVWNRAFNQILFQRWIQIIFSKCRSV